MNIPTTIHVLTVVCNDAHILYQQVYVNREEDAQADFRRQHENHKDELLDGWTISLKRF